MFRQKPQMIKQLQVQCVSLSIQNTTTVGDNSDAKYIQKENPVSGTQFMG